MIDERSRSRREWDALAHVSRRHGDETLTPYEAARLVMMRAGGSARPRPDGPAVDHDDLAAALTLVGRARAELDALELGLLETARHRGMTWQALAHGVGLGSAQAAKQRHDRLVERRRSAEETD
ncbi:hypothetical protein Val02_02360 [Virgisporangium aliadipatigenens]|uniref:DNA-binding protein n=1 Tax=Virgisporangium aliadipatigenens TaxID=741659 RepID=A0A8J3YG24_9ACTN|nr:DNA-binding protein [Virgisporangium aliadipatigenens]GIJ43350.1 hypothetical protein Val02_02360 [Virgisporangium aliadipatigenens]